MNQERGQKLKDMNKKLYPVQIRLTPLDYLYLKKVALKQGMNLRELMARIVAEYILSQINSDEKLVEVK